MRDASASAVTAPASAAVSPHGVPPGSLRYFAVLFAVRGARPQLEALYAFEAEVRRVVAGASHEAAHARLQWWRGELDRLAAGRPTHPIAVALATLRERGSADLPLLQESLDAADLDLARFTYHTWTELEAYCFRSAGALQTLAAAALAGERALSPAERTFARRLGAALRQTEMLRDLSHDLSRGRLYAPLDALAAAGLEPGALSRAIEDGAAARLLTEWRNRLQDEFAALPSLLVGREARSTQRHGLVLAALHSRLLERLGTGPAGTTRTVELPPLARLWTAWRTALHYG